MSSETQLPQEWKALPAWVKDELIDSSEDLSFYSGYIHRLVVHGENMKAVWRQFELHRDAFGCPGPVHSLVKLMFEAKPEAGLGYLRTDDDRRSIAKDVQKHVSALLKIVDRLRSGGPFGMYPPEVTGAITSVACDVATDRVGRPFEAELNKVLARMDAHDVPSEISNSIADQLRCMQKQLESEVMDLISDPRPSLRALADATREWEKVGDSGRDDAIWYIESTFREWFRSNQFSATATLATAILDEEVSVDVVAGVVKRRTIRLR